MSFHNMHNVTSRNPVPVSANRHGNPTVSSPPLFVDPRQSTYAGSRLLTNVPILDESSRKNRRRVLRSRAFSAPTAVHDAPGRPPRVPEQDDRGVCFGDVVQIHGEHAVGKTFLLMHVLVQCILPREYGGHGMQAVWIYCVKEPCMVTLVNMVMVRVIHGFRPSSSRCTIEPSAMNKDIKIQADAFIESVGRTPFTKVSDTEAIPTMTIPVNMAVSALCPPETGFDVHRIINECLERLSIFKADSSTCLIATLHSIQTTRQKRATQPISVFVDDFTTWFSMDGEPSGFSQLSPMESSERSGQEIYDDIPMSGLLSEEWNNTYLEPADYQPARALKPSMQVLFGSIIRRLVASEEIAIFLSSAASFSMHNPSRKHGDVTEAEALVRVSSQWTKFSRQVAQHEQVIQGRPTARPAGCLESLYFDFLVGRVYDHMPNEWRNLVTHAILAFPLSPISTQQLDSWRSRTAISAISAGLAADMRLHSFYSENLHFEQLANWNPPIGLALGAPVVDWMKMWPAVLPSAIGTITFCSHEAQGLDLTHMLLDSIT